jgi:SpoVK/Ycf46/Vps4 family AAA+-type ATPase
MLCAASPKVGKVYHKWIPKISEKVALLKENAKLSDIKEYYQKIYPKANSEDIEEVSKEFVAVQKKKVALAKIYPTLKLDEIELLSTIVTDNDINQHERDSGN